MTDVLNILALDVGDARVGVAMANTVARLPSPLAIVDNDEKILENLSAIIEDNQISTIVVGLPRNMQGEETAQSKISRGFTNKLTQITDANIVFADEGLSSKRAAEHSPDKKHVDDIAACFILEEYLRGSE